MLLPMALFHSFLWLSNIPLYICTTSSLFIDISSIEKNLKKNEYMYMYN